MIKVNRENIFFLLFLFLPISIIVGSTISLVNVIILDVFFLFILISERNHYIFKNLTFKLLFFLYLYLIFNSFISLNYEIGLARNIGFIRILILFIAINYFFFNYEKEKIFFDIWTILLSIFIIDIFTEYFFGSNIFGWGVSEIDGEAQPNGMRIMSLFKDEPIAGAFLSGFIFLVFGHLLKRFDKKFYALVFISIAFFGLVLTGERSNAIKIFLGIIIFFILFDFIKLKTKVTIFLLFSFVFGLILHQSEYLNSRYIGQIFVKVNTQDGFKYNLENYKEENKYFNLYKSGYAVFKKYPIFGVGNKNYRVETCGKAIKVDTIYYQCTTHPHQIYYEFLSEHGIIGTIILLSILFILMFRILKCILLSKNYLQIGAFIFVLINFIPLLPSGSFFNDFNATIFWINFSIMFACNKKTNIFERN